MDILEEMFCKKLNEECTEFKHEIMRTSKAEIFGEAYRIDSIINIYEILLEKAGQLSDTLLWLLIQQPNVLELFYERWLKKEDNAYEELQQHVEEELKNFVQIMIEGSGCKNEAGTFIKCQ